MGKADRVKVIHVGPSPADIGGMETVLRVYRDASWEAFEVQVIASTLRGSLWRKIRTFTHALRKLLRAPNDVVVHVHLSQRGSFVREGALILLSSFSKKVFATIHGSSFVETAEKPSWRLLYRFVLSSLDAVGVLNSQAYEATCALAGKRKLVVLPNVGPVQPVPLSSGVAVRSSIKRVVFAGSVGLRKGVDLLIGAWERVRIDNPDSELILLGPIEPDVPNDLREALEPFARGPRDSAAVHRELSDAWCAVLPSMAEGQPMFLLEALAFGTPILVTDIGGMPGLAEGCGRIVPSGNANALGDALSNLLSTSEEEWNRLSVEAQRKYSRDFSLQVHEARLRELYSRDQPLLR